MFKFCCLSWKTNVHQEFRTATSATHGCSAEYLQNKFAKIPGNYLPAATYLFKVKNNRRMCQIRSKLTIKTSRWHHWHCSGVFIVKTERTLSWCFLSWLYIYIYCWFGIGIHSMKSWTATTKHGVIRKKD